MSPGTRAGMPGAQETARGLTRMLTWPLPVFSGSGANLQVLGGDEDLSFAHASPDTSVQRRGPL
jgi:hypothetical protein